MARATRALTIILVVLTTLLGALTLDPDTDAKRRHKRHHHRKSDRQSERQLSGVPWAGEQTVSIRYRGIDDPRLIDAYQQVVADMNTLTAHIPNAPRWLFVDEPFMTCETMADKRLSGINICTEQPEDEFLADGFCGAGGPQPIKTKKKGMADGWYSPIYLHLPPTCGQAFGAANGIAHHEMSHAWLGCPSSHPDDWSCGGARPWGPGDFQQAEQWFGKSSVPFCGIYPDGYGC